MNESESNVPFLTKVKQLGASLVKEKYSDFAPTWPCLYFHRFSLIGESRVTKSKRRDKMFHLARFGVSNLLFAASHHRAIRAWRKKLSWNQRFLLFDRESSHTRYGTLEVCIGYGRRGYSNHSSTDEYVLWWVQINLLFANTFWCTELNHSVHNHSYINILKLVISLS